MSPPPGADPSGEQVPALREGVHLEIGADGNGTLSDALMGRRIKLDARAVGICARMTQGGTTVQAIAEAVGAPPDAVRSFVGRLVSLDLCATERAAARAGDRRALAAVKAKPALHLRMLEGARFSCTMCGSCCGGHNVGPVSEAVLDGLEPELDALAAEVRAGRRTDKDLFLALPGGGGLKTAPDLVCSASHGSCVFLDDSGRCRIHARMGGAAKPLPCRIFPYELVATPTGVRVTVQRECRDFLRATGPEMPTLAEATDEVTALVEALETLPAPALVPKLRGAELASWAAWEALEGELSGAVGDDPLATFSRLGALVGATPIDGTPGFAAWRAALVRALRQIHAQAPPASERMQIRVDSLALAIDALEAGRGWVLGRALAPLEDDEARRLFREHLRHALWSTAPLRATSIEAGVGRLVAEWVLARLIALTRARTVKRFHVTSQDLLDGLVTASFLFRHEDLRAILTELDPLGVAVFVDGLATLYTRAPDDDEPDRRVELVKF